MYVNVAVLKETHPHERRVALVPSVVAKLVKLGAKLHMQLGAGDAVSLVDAAFKDVSFMADRHALVGDADVVLAVQPPALDVINAMKEGAILISFIYASKEPALVKRLLDKKITCFAMDRIPRITRAQAMDALSSQSALAGYYAVQLGATHLARVLPKITSAAGAIGPAKVLVMGLGVAGLEAVATAHRLGAVVEGYDVRPETGEQVASLGATFVETGVDARGKGGYARELTAAEKAKIDAVVDKAYPAVGPDHHHGSHPRTALTETHQQVAGRRHESRRRDRRSVSRRRRKLRGHATGRDRADRAGDDRRAAQRAFVARAGCQRTVREECRGPARADDEGQHHHPELGR